VVSSCGYRLSTATAFLLRLANLRPHASFGNVCVVFVSGGLSRPHKSKALLHHLEKKKGGGD
jgi:hypothetical protein